MATFAARIVTKCGRVPMFTAARGPTLRCMSRTARVAAPPASRIAWSASAAPCAGWRSVAAARRIGTRSATSTPTNRTAVSCVTSAKPVYPARINNRPQQGP